MVDSFWWRGFATVVGGSRTRRWPLGLRCAPRTTGWRGGGRGRARPPRSQLGARPLAQPAARGAIAAIERLRRQRLSGPQIAQAWAARRHRRLRAPSSRPRPPRRPRAEPAVIRYQRSRPASCSTSTPRSSAASTASATASPAIAAGPASGWEILHVAIDDPPAGLQRILPDERRPAPAPHPRSPGSSAARLDRQRLRLPRLAAGRPAGLPSSAPPYTPRTNGKAERFIQTALREWVYARPYASSSEAPPSRPGFLQSPPPHAGIHASPTRQD